MEVEPVISSDPSYGACDLPTDAAERLGIDVIFHFGHSTFVFPTPKTFSGSVHYFPVEANISVPWDILVGEIRSKSWTRVGLLLTVQHLRLAQEARQRLGTAGITIEIYREGQILGCNYDRGIRIAPLVDGFLVIAGGDFHAGPVVIATGKPTIRYDPFNGSKKFFGNDYRNQYLAKRYAMIQKAKEAKNWGVLLSTKSGQMPADNGKRIIGMLKKAGLNATPFMMSRIDPLHLTNFETIDAWVISLCPRIATDDYISFNKPILTTRELSVVLGDMQWLDFISPKAGEELLTIL